MRWVMLLVLFFAGAAFTSFEYLHLPYPQGYFHWPVNYAIRFSGSFGELRPNHFHAGVDIRSSAGRVGDPLYAAAEGFVARIKVEESGYGKSLYIAHPNGYTTVYGHMDRFTEELERFVRQEQYAEQCFEADLYPSPHLFTFRQGQYIGNMGNTGASAGPHVHFEVRESVTDKAFNPLLFGFPVTDKMAPKIYTLKLYQMDGLGVYGTETRNVSVKARDGYFYPEPETLAVNTPFAAFALNAYDMQNSTSNRNGIYKMDMQVDGVRRFQFALDEVPFEDSRYINAHVDYEEQVTKRSYYHRCFRLPGNQLHIYPVEINHGIIPLETGEVKLVEIRVSDMAENESLLRFWVRREGEKDPPLPGPYQYYLYQDRDNLVQTDNCSLFIPQGTIYEDLPLNYRTVAASGSSYLSEVFHIHNYLTPAHQFYVLSLKSDRTLKESDRIKAFIAYINPKGSILNCGGVWRGDVLTTPVRQFGPYAIMVDKTPPSVSPSYFKYDMRGKRAMSFRISDNFSTAPNMDKLYFSATVDGQWILMEYDRKSGRITHQFDGRISSGKHQLRLEVTDVMGNSTVYEKSFLR
ncbi:MAG: M23 family metallopeptidase [Saprospirales bacterium]|nr:M23 family metallopeptidase [Saprospirales bacterium]MBK8491569.1 M23 family metallopeptidase [Saprospirales bacterium]